MQCPECLGSGQIVLLMSARQCERCFGTGIVVSEELGEDTDKAFFDEESDFYVGGGGDADGLCVSPNYGTGGHVHLASGPEKVTGDGGHINLTCGKNLASTYPISVSPPPPPAISLKTQEGYSGHIYLGTADPRELPLNAPKSSLYVRDDGEEGSLWVKTGNKDDGWEKLTTQGDSRASDPYRTQRCQVWGDGKVFDRAHVLAHAADILDAHKKLTDQVHADEISMDSFHEMVGELPINEYVIPTMAPISHHTLADLMAVVEQTSNEVVAFVMSSREYGDIRKFSRDTLGFELEDLQTFYFGAPIWHSPEIPKGYLAAVSTDKTLAVATVYR